MIQQAKTKFSALELQRTSLDALKRELLMLREKQHSRKQTLVHELTSATDLLFGQAVVSIEKAQTIVSFVSDEIKKIFDRGNEMVNTLSNWRLVTLVKATSLDWVNVSLNQVAFSTFDSLTEKQSIKRRHEKLKWTIYILSTNAESILLLN
ncbi:unnamed protein product [Dibothriocephalus latus]|uniref:Uncharacterized protein n=1 Tax=Dibothriocephalus latus TaxID=60516 RepID=A0A3P7KY79_DIBLA|nr:unnamed protein product [Dibothriocephalus latus]